MKRAHYDFSLPVKSRAFRAAILGIALATSSISLPSYGASSLSTESIGAWIQQMNDLAQNLDQSAQVLLQNGNNALAQQQIMLAGNIRQLVSQVSAAYKDNLNITFNHIDVTEYNSILALNSALSQVGSLEGKTSKDIQDVVYKVQGDSNQILDRLPFTNRIPVFYGTSVRDMVADPAANPADIEVLGFAFTDQHLQFQKPVVRIAGIVLPDSAISIQNDRLQIQIPEAIKQKIGLTGNPCKPRATFGIDIQVFYTTPELFGLLHKKLSTTFHANALAGAPRYTMNIVYDVNRTDKHMEGRSFSATSSQVDVGCENDGAGSVSVNLPSDAIDIQCSPTWVNASNIKSNSAGGCAVAGTTASDTFTVRGLDYQRVSFLGGSVANCPGGGHIALQLNGTYKVAISSTSHLTNLPAGGAYILSGNLLHVAMPSDTAAVITRIHVTICNVGCTSTLDNIDINMPSNQSITVTQTSNNGIFDTSFFDGQLTITKHQI